MRKLKKNIILILCVLISLSFFSCTDAKAEKNVVVVVGYILEGKDKIELVIKKYKNNNSIGEVFSEGTSYSLKAIDKSGNIILIKQFDFKNVTEIPECPKATECKTLTNKEFKIVFEAPVGVTSIQIMKGKEKVAEKTLD